MDALLTRLQDVDLFRLAAEIWLKGGWAMIALAINSLLLFGIGMHVWLRLRERGFRSVPERTWKRWIANPEQRTGPIGRLVEFAMNASDLEDLEVRFNELQSTELAPFERDLKFMRRAVSTAPLLGLLGTVTGMLATFGALASGSGGEKTMDMVSLGISEALVTTETGLLIALPGLFFQFHLSRGRDRYAAFLAHLETVCAQTLWVWKQVDERSGGLADEAPPAAP